MCVCMCLSLGVRVWWGSPEKVTTTSSPLSLIPHHTHFLSPFHRQRVRSAWMATTRRVPPLPSLFSHPVTQDSSCHAEARAHQPIPLHAARRCQQLLNGSRGWEYHSESLKTWCHYGLCTEHQPPAHNKHLKWNPVKKFFCFFKSALKLSFLFWLSSEPLHGCHTRCCLRELMREYLNSRKYRSKNLCFVYPIWIILCKDKQLLMQSYVKQYSWETSVIYSGW